MTRYGRFLPQLGGRVFLTDGGIETSLIYLDGIELPHFAAFPLLDSVDGREALKNYFRRYLRIASDQQTGFVLESPTWRANPDWATLLDYERDALAKVNRRAIDLMQDLRNEYENPHCPIVISGCIGPRGDGYRPASLMSVAEASDYHAFQAQQFRLADADMVTAITMCYAEEAIGITRAAQAALLPVVISFTVETDGNLPTGQSLEEAIQEVDSATDSAPIYYMINCAHPSHFENLLVSGGEWVRRIRGIRANASSCSHAELDEATELDDGDPDELGQRYAVLRSQCPQLNVFGGCCGTDQRHVGAIALAVQGAVAPPGSSA